MKRVAFLPALASGMFLVSCASSTPPPPHLVSGPSTHAALLAVTSAVKGELDSAAQVSMALSDTASFGGGTGSATGSYLFPKLSGQITLKIKGQKTSETIVYVPTAAYYKFPSGTAPEGAKPWAEASLSDKAALGTNFPQTMLQIEAMNPGFILSQLTSGITSAAPAGNSVINGTPVAIYSAIVNLATAQDHAQGTASQLYKPAMSGELAAATPTPPPPVTVTFSVAIDGSGRLVRVVADLPGSGVGNTTLTLGPLANPPSVTPPPKSQTSAVSEIGDQTTEKPGGDGDGS
jgi:hypothetical protein